MSIMTPENFTSAYERPEDISVFLSVYSHLRSEALTLVPSRIQERIGIDLPIPSDFTSFTAFCTACEHGRAMLRTLMSKPQHAAPSGGKGHQGLLEGFRYFNTVLSYPLKFPATPVGIEAQCLQEYVDFELNHDFSFDVELASKMRKVIHRWLEGLSLEVIPRGFGPGVTNVTSREQIAKYNAFRRPGPEISGLVDDTLPIGRFEDYSRPLCVPKTWKRLRVIGPEPVYGSHLQHGLMRILYRHFATHKYLRSRMNLYDQTRNQILAELGSVTGLYATVDLSAASDSVAWELVDYLFQGTSIYDLLVYSRTPYALHPLSESELIPLKKFAGMGSGMTFPVESLIFGGLLEVLIPRAYMQGFGPSWSVYGDDLVVPSAYYDDVLDGLIRLGFKPNFDKSFNGSYLESCGKEYCCGHDVTPIYFRVPRCSDTLVNTDNYLSWIACVNNLHHAHLPETRRFCMQLLFKKRYNCGSGSRPVTPMFTTDIEDTSAIFSTTRANRLRIRRYNGSPTWIQEVFSTYVVTRPRRCGDFLTMQPVHDWCTEREYTPPHDEEAAQVYGKTEGRLVTGWHYANLGARGEVL